MLFEDFNSQPLEIALPNADLSYWPTFLNESDANYYTEELLNSIPWRGDTIQIFGKSILQPRLTAFYGDPTKVYSYSTIKMYPSEWIPLLSDLKQKIEEISKSNFNSVLLNLYRDGNDSNGWHADNEKELGKNPTIASLSLGSSRDFQLKHNEISDAKKTIHLTNGSLLVMSGEMQHYWKHQIPKRKNVNKPRINLTFRNIR